MKTARKEDEYYFDRTIVFDNAIVSVYRPIISDEENERRMQKIADAAAQLIMSKEIKDPVALSRIRATIIKRDFN